MTAARIAQPFTRGPVTPRRVQALKPGDRLVYRLGSQTLTETVRAVSPVPQCPGYVAVRFVGRDIDQHYQLNTTVGIAA